MNELRIPLRLQEGDIQRVLADLAQDFEGKVDYPAPGAASISFPIRHRFFSGELKAAVRWNGGDAETVFHAEVDDRAAGLSHAGKMLLVLGALATLPPILCWYLPSLMPLVPLSLLLAFLAWLGVVRKPAYFSPEFYLRRLNLLSK